MLELRTFHNDKQALSISVCSRFTKDKNMPTISVAMIVKNEAHHLASCLDTVKDWVDEIVILDSGSTDDTQRIAEQYHAKFYQNTDWPGFGKQRQLCIVAGRGRTGHAGIASIHSKCHRAGRAEYGIQNPALK